VRINKFGGPEVLEIEECNIPSPEPREILIKVEAIGINPVETYIRAGTHYKPNLPLTPGHDASGVIHQIGRDVKNFKVGERVYTSQTLTGAYAQYTLTSETGVHKLPEHFTFEQGAAINTPYATAYHAIFQIGRATEGETILVHGASGGVGIACIQLAKSKKLVIIGTAGSEEGLQFVQNLGAHHVLNHRDENHFEKIMKITNNKGVDVVVEMLANVNLAKDLKILAERGRCLIVGSRGPIEIDPRDTMAKRSEILGVALGKATAEEKTIIHQNLYQLFLSNDLNPIISYRYKLSEVAKAHHQIINPPSTGILGKLILLPYD